MSEVREFWGLAVRGYRGGYPASVLREGWSLSAPDSKAIPLYPVFSSKEKAQEFANEVFARGNNSDIGSHARLDLLEHIRRIDPDEIPPEHYVVSDREGLVKWREIREQGNA
jgi:hypothetical protein